MFDSVFTQSSGVLILYINGDRRRAYPLKIVPNLYTDADADGTASSDATSIIYCIQ